MRITVHFYSYYKDISGCAEAHFHLGAEPTIHDLLILVRERFPRIAEMQNSMLIAVGVEYQPQDYALKNGDEVSLFPPVQGG